MKRVPFARLIGLWWLALAGAAHAQAPAAPPAPLKILHVMSYHSPWRWTDGQFEGFKAGLGDVPAEFRIVQLDAKRHSAPDEMAARGREARALVESWKPDLVYTTDDDAQELVTRHYLGGPLPQVFSGVNKAPAHYGFDRAGNVTGVIEHEHFAESVLLLKRVVPSLKRLVVVLDDAPMWGPVVQRMQAAPLPPGVSIVGWETLRSFDEFKARMAAYPAIADGVALIGIFSFKDRDGRNVPYQEVLRWTAEHSRLPDLGLWIDRVHHGTLVAVTVSEREQGLAAGRLARRILVDGASPASLPIRATTKGLPVISLARARKLGIAVRSEQLLASQVITTFEWDKP